MSAQQIWRMLFGMSAVLLLLLAFSYPAIEPGTGTYVVSILSLFFILATMIGTLIVMYLGWEPFAVD